MAEWEQAKFTVIPRETLDGINNALNSAISFLDRIDQALDALEALVNILALSIVTGKQIGRAHV